MKGTNWVHYLPNSKLLFWQLKMEKPTNIPDDKEVSI